MDTFADVIQIANTAVFVTVAVVVFVQRRRRADAASAWIAATFGTLAAVFLFGQFLPDEPEGTLEVGVLKLLVVGLVLYPWLLYRFMAAFDRPSPALELIVNALTVGVIAYTLLLPSFPSEDQARPLWFELYVLALVAQWSLLGVVVAARLWRAGSGHATLTRRRMQVLAAGSTLMILALLPAVVPTERQPGAVRVITQLFPLLSAGLFLVGFAPPGWLRTVWRRQDHNALREAEMQLMKVATAQDVGHALLPHVVRVFGGNGAMLVGPTGRPSAVHGMTDREARDLAVPLWPLRSQEPIVLEGQPGVLALPLRSGWLVVQATPYTPFFGVEELSLLQELGSFTDLALQRAELLEKERQARVAVEQTNTELETLVYGVSHDLKSPLISLMGYLEYLQLDHAAALDEEARHYLNRMSASAVYMQQLIQDLLELSRIGRVQTDASDVRLGDLLDEVAAEVRQRHPDVTIDVAPLPVVRINPVRGRQLFTNLMENAARHGGRRDVRIRVTSLGESRGRFEISVADDGVGIPEPYRERVFGIFERLDTLEMEDLGTGMGLAICRKIVEQVGGDISIAPSEVGADVRVLLPAASVDDAFGGRPVEEVHR